MVHQIDKESLQICLCFCLCHHLSTFGATLSLSEVKIMHHWSPGDINVLKLERFQTKSHHRWISHQDCPSVAEATTVGMHMIQSVKQPTEETSFFPHLDCDSNIEIAATVTGLGPLICNDVNFDSSIRMMRHDVELTFIHRQVGMANLEFQRTYHLCTTSVLILSSEALEDPSEALHHFVSLDWTANFTGTTGEPKVHTTLTSLHDLMHIDKFQGAATFSVSL